VQNVASWTKAGVMIRETVDPGAAQAFMLVSSSKGQAYQRRQRHVHHRTGDADRAGREQSLDVGGGDARSTT